MPAHEAALKEAKVKLSTFRPVGTQHGFHNDTTPRYDDKAAHRAWELTTALFERQLRKPA